MVLLWMEAVPESRSQKQPPAEPHTQSLGLQAGLFPDRPHLPLITLRNSHTALNLEICSRRLAAEWRLEVQNQHWASLPRLTCPPWTHPGGLGGKLIRKAAFQFYILLLPGL